MMETSGINWRSPVKLTPPRKLSGSASPLENCDTVAAGNVESKPAGEMRLFRKSSQSGQTAASRPPVEVIAGSQTPLLHRIAAGLGLGFIGLTLAGCGPTPLEQNLKTISAQQPLQQKVCAEKFGFGGPDFMPIFPGFRTTCTTEIVTPREAAKLIEKGSPVTLSGGEQLGSAQEIQARAEFLQGSNMGASPEVAGSVRALESSRMLTEQGAATLLSELGHGQGAKVTVPYYHQADGMGIELHGSEQVVKAGRLFQINSESPTPEKALAFFDSGGRRLAWQGLPAGRILANSLLDQGKSVEVSYRDLLNQPQTATVKETGELVQLYSEVMQQQNQRPTEKAYRKGADAIAAPSLGLINQRIFEAKKSLAIAEASPQTITVDGLVVENADRASQIKAAKQRLDSANLDKENLSRTLDRVKEVVRDPWRASDTQEFLKRSSSGIEDMEVREKLTDLLQAAQRPVTPPAAG